MRLLQSVWFDRIACALFALTVLVGLWLPGEICILADPDGTRTIRYDIIEDPPTGESITCTIYEIWRIAPPLLAGIVFYLFRSTRHQWPPIRRPR
jgi:hypothetical protein